LLVQFQLHQLSSKVQTVQSLSATKLLEFPLLSSHLRLFSPDRSDHKSSLDLSAHSSLHHLTDQLSSADKQQTSPPADNDPKPVQIIEFTNKLSKCTEISWSLGNSKAFVGFHELSLHFPAKSSRFSLSFPVELRVSISTCRAQTKSHRCATELLRQEK
jgi:hypothetical protein